jgi:rhamnogalacturonyl hydrolase YesR
MYQPALANLNHMFTSAPLGGRQWGWCDLLFMAPPAITRVALVSKTPALLDSMTTYYSNTSKTLYDTVAHLYFRDPSFIYPAQKTSHGNKVFWSRGNGWVEAGLARVLQYLPANYSSRSKYVTQFQQMSAALKAVQGGDGLWRTSLYDTIQYPDPEMSGTCFFAFGMAWGINNGILDRATFEPSVRKAWSGMVKNVAANGALMRVQDVGTQPGTTSVNMSKPYAEGAFCLTGKEMIALVTTTGVHQSAATPQTAKRTGIAAKQALICGTQHFVVPAGATGYSVFNLAGQSLYSSRRLDAAHAETAVLPAELRNASQAVLVKFDYGPSR